MISWHASERKTMDSQFYTYCLVLFLQRVCLLDSGNKRSWVFFFESVYWRATRGHTRLEDSRRPSDWKLYQGWTASVRWEDARVISGQGCGWDKIVLSRGLPLAAQYDVF
jgi:hypothetical protein